MLEKMKLKADALFESLKSSLELTPVLMSKVVVECKDPLADWLDKKVRKYFLHIHTE